MMVSSYPVNISYRLVSTYCMPGAGKYSVVCYLLPPQQPALKAGIMMIARLQGDRMGSGGSEK